MNQKILRRVKQIRLQKSPHLLKMRQVCNLYYPHSMKKLTKEHPELGNQGSLSINYTGATFSSNQQEYAVFLLINKAGFQIDKDFDFSLNWKYDGQFIYQNQRIGYKISDSGVLPDQSATILTLPISSEQKQIVETMTQEEKMTLEMSDLKVNK